MKRALVVDDERLVRKGFISLIDWSSYGIAIVGEASDGKSALNMLQNIEIDLIFTDITMPGMSGFELIKIVRQQYPNIHSVVLTCHHEFDFIQEALRLGAIDYMVKTLLELETMDKVIRRIVERIEWEESSRVVFNAVKLEKRFPTVDAVIFSSTTGEEKSGGLYHYTVVQKNSLIELDHFCLTPLIHQISAEEWSSDLAGLAKAGWRVALLTGLKDRLLDDINAVVKEKLDKVLFYTAERSGMVKADFDALHTLKSADSSGVESILNELKWTLYAPELARLIGMAEEQRPSPDRLAAIGIGFCRMWGGILLLHEEAAHLERDIASLRVWADWKIWLNRFAVGVKGRMIDLCLSKEVMFCLIRAMAYMRKHACDKINQKDVAAHINMSRSYFSQCFAKFAGESFGETLRNLRIEHAKSLLVDTDYSVYEIASMTGFEDEKYFSKMFRDRVGLPPSKYRIGHNN